MRTVIQVLFVVIIIILGYLIVESIMEPIRFNQEVETRERATIDKLIDIREAQKAYKDVYKRYTGSFDTLISFLKHDSFSVIKAIGTIPEEWLEELGLEDARERAIKEGVISRETTKVAVRDSLFGGRYSVDSLRYVPFTEGATFNMESSKIVTSSNLEVQVVEVSIHYDELLKGLDEQLIVNYKDERMKIVGFEGVKFGSLEEGTLTGNWE
ncbi:MAG: hypothetical protein EHM46_07020 [Bacteroidetes bacterium]|nr:MAG: hypothetical protein EHM46_07020 [Bacteroidota bacterium]